MGTPCLSTASASSSPRCRTSSFTMESSHSGEPRSLVWLHLGKVPFENVTSMNLQALRESGKATLGQMPILEVDGKTCVQTGAIARYCGKLSGLYPKDDDWAAAKIDEIIDTATDITVHVGKTFGMEAAAKAAARAELAATTLPKYLTALERIMTEN